MTWPVQRAADAAERGDTGDDAFTDATEARSSARAATWGKENDRALPSCLDPLHHHMTC